MSTRGGPAPTCPARIVVGLLVGGAVSFAVAVFGLVVVRRDRWAAYVASRRAVLLSLLVTQVFLFRIEEWSATGGLLVDPALLGLVSAELSQMDAERRESAAGRAVRRGGREVR